MNTISLYVNKRGIIAAREHTSKIFETIGNYFQLQLNTFENLVSKMSNILSRGPFSNMD